VGAGAPPYGSIAPVLLSPASKHHVNLILPFSRDFPAFSPETVIFEM